MTCRESLPIWQVGRCNMVALSHRSSASSSSVLTKVNAHPLGKTAQIIPYGKIKFPPLEDYRRACAALIWSTFRAASHNAVCDNAERETGLDAEKFSRILSGHTQKPDGYLMFIVVGIAACKRVAIPDALIIRAD